MENKAYQPSVMSQISHELRIPLTGIMGMAHFLSETSLTPQQQDYLKSIQTSAQRLLAFENLLQSLLKEQMELLFLMDLMMTSNTKYKNFN